MIAAPGAVSAAERTDFGKREYQANCAGCHGVSG
jgi:mono/diheme cytochrome c family protein